MLSAALPQTPSPTRRLSRTGLGPSAANFFRSGAPSPPSSIYRAIRDTIQANSGPKYIKESFEVVADNISLIASSSPSPVNHDRDAVQSGFYKPQLEVSIGGPSSGFTNAQSEIKGEIPAQRALRASRALSASLKDAQKHLTTVIEMRDAQRLYASYQTTLLAELEKETALTSLELQTKKNELDGLDEEIRVLKSMSKTKRRGTFSGIEKKAKITSRLPLHRKY